MRILFCSTANHGHFGPLLPFVRACTAAGHEVRVAAPESFGGALARAGVAHQPFADVPAAVIGPIMSRLPALSLDEADDVVVREVFAGVDAQAALPGLTATIERWHPQLIVRESAELGSVAAAERAGVPHVHVTIGMHEVARRFAEMIEEPIAELGRLAGLGHGRLSMAVADEMIFSLVPETLDYPTGDPLPGAERIRRFHQPDPVAAGPRPEAWGDPDRPLVYVTFGSVAASLPPFAGVFAEALDAVADLDASVLMSVGRGLDPADLEPLPDNARVLQWVPQDEVLVHAAAILGHGGFGTTMGALTTGVPQSVVPLFTFDQVVNGDHVAAVGAGTTTERGAGAVARGVAAIPGLLQDPGYRESARRTAAALRALPLPAEAVPLLIELAGPG